jgi:Cysteine-rich secretory protein family
MKTRTKLFVAGSAVLWAVVPAMAQDAGFSARMLARHNGERAVVGVKPLLWDAKLAAAAAGWANHLAKTRQFDHAPDDPNADPQGENLWMGTARAYSLEDMVDGWIEERQYYRAGLFPNVTTTRNWTDVGHYTQLIWHNTTHVGCALATGGGNDVLVCRYSPPGNWDGESPTGQPARTIKRKQ